MINQNDSIYAIYLKLDQFFQIQVGKLGEFSFPPGIYIYVGSAKRNIEARVNRHVKLEKPKRWHFDYLRPYGEIVKIETFNDQLTECERYEAIRSLYSGFTVAKGFGSSDCKCETHLIFTNQKVI